MLLLICVFLLVLNFNVSTKLSNDDPVISGSGRWKYQYMPDLLHFPNETELGNGHGLCKDKKGQIYFTFQPKHKTAYSQALVRFQPDGTNGVLLGDKGPDGLSMGVPHGLRIDYSEGTGYLYHANNQATVMKTTLEGKIVWKSDFTDIWKNNKTVWPYKPTDAVVVPNTNTLLVADGYGQSWVHKLDKRTGEYLNASFGGKGNTSSDPIRFNTPHGINLDPQGNFIVSDRSNNRLVTVDQDGHYKTSSLTTKVAGVSLPCNVDFMKASAIDGGGMLALVPSLGKSYHPYLNGSVAIYNTSAPSPNPDPISVIEVARWIGHLGHQHPHDAIFLPSGDMVICCWSGPSDGPDFGPAKGTISYWKRLPA